MNPKKKKLVLTVLGGVVLYLASTGITFAAFRFLQESQPGLISPVSVEEGRAKIDLSAPKTEACPLNGKFFTRAEREIWEGRRPLAVMIENHADARPQSGLSYADVVYEAVAEGGITRFMAVFYCGAAAQDVTIGPVRSARTYFLDWASEYGDYPLYAHVGGANQPGPSDALGQIGEYGWLRKRNDLNQFSLGFPVYWRDYERLGHETATEHTMYSSTDKLWEEAQSRGLEAVDEEGYRWDESFTPWSFKEEAAPDKRGDLDAVEFNFWRGYEEYAVTWRYNREANEFYRLNGNQPQKDLDNDRQLKAKTVVIQFTQEKGPIDDLKHLLYTTLGSGKVLVFQDGEVIEGKWQKSERESRTEFTDSRGTSIEFNPGPIWIEILPLGQEVAY